MRRAHSSGRGSWELVRDDDSFGVSADGLGNVYISGYTDGSLGGPNAGGDDAFVSKYDAAGNFQWTQQLGTSATDESSACRPTAWGMSTSRATPTAAWAGQTPAATTHLWRNIADPVVPEPSTLPLWPRWRSYHSPGDGAACGLLAHAAANR